METYDIVIIGGGPGGLSAAEHAAKLGASVAIVESGPLGGTCLNRGCIPSKTLLRHSEVIELIQKAKKWGIETGTLQFSFGKMMERKNNVIHRLRQGAISSLTKLKVVQYHGTAMVYPDHRIEIEKRNGTERIRGEKIILATGSKPFIPPVKGTERVFVHTSDTIFDIERLPRSLVIIGGGYIGVEFACIFSSLNVEVILVEMKERLLPGEDEDAARFLSRELTRKNVRILTSAKVLEIAEAPEHKIVRIETEAGERLNLDAEEILFASGRKPNLTGLSRLNLEMNGAFVAVNKQMQTNLPNIYAIGDVIGGWQLAHVASAEGIVAASNAAGRYREIDYRAVPRCIYTMPEIASVGLSEKEALEKGYKIRTETFQLGATGKAWAMDELHGFVKLIADTRYDEILGMVMVGPHVTEMISEISACISLEGTVGELASMIHPHPTLSEGIAEVAKAWLEKRYHLQ